MTVPTIVAVATPPGRGGVGMVRISGTKALSIARRIFTPTKGWGPFPPPSRKSMLGVVHHPSSSGIPLPPSLRIDQALFLHFPGPHSFTGEDVVELTAHGSPLVMEKVLEAALQAGARLAEPGEFSRRAFLNGKMDLTQAEAVAGVVHAATVESLRVMTAQREGAMGKAARTVRERLRESKVLLESAIDFPEDVGPLDEARLRRLWEASERDIGELLATAGEGIALREGATAVLVGLPNTGKSSLLNTLLKEDRAIVHPLPGTTRDLVDGWFSVKGIPFRLVDTAGIRSEPEGPEAEGISRAKRMVEQADLLLLVLDGSEGLRPEERELMESTKGKPRLVLVNKSDLPQGQGACFPEEALPVSALTGKGLESLREAIPKALFPSRGDFGEAVVISHRQKLALRRAAEACARGLKDLRETATPECLAVAVDEGLAALADLVGETVTEDILDDIFSRFCIGK